MFPGAIYAYENGVCLPLYPGMPADDVEYVCDKIDEFYRK
jgi:dTDP-4-amino-4,6-dideoxygalactose transaminase